MRSQALRTAPTEPIDDEILDLCELLIDRPKPAVHLLTKAADLPVDSLLNGLEARTSFSLEPGKLLAKSVDGLSVGVRLNCEVVEPPVHPIEALVYPIEALIHPIEPRVHAIEPLVYPIEPRVHPVEPHVHTVDSLSQCTGRCKNRAIVRAVGFQRRNAGFEVGQRGHCAILSPVTEPATRQMAPCG
jgi:hypothetical protein